MTYKFPLVFPAVNAKTKAIPDGYEQSLTGFNKWRYSLYRMIEENRANQLIALEKSVNNYPKAK